MLFFTLFCCIVWKNVHFEGLYLFFLHQHTVTINSTIRKYFCHITSTEQTVNGGDLSCLFGLNLLSYGNLSIYVLLMRFGLLHLYNIQENTG